LASAEGVLTETSRRAKNSVLTPQKEKRGSWKLGLLFIKALITSLHEEFSKYNFSLKV
jgi:hypothetical protein